MKEQTLNETTNCERNVIFNYGLNESLYLDIIKYLLLDIYDG